MLETSDGPLPSEEHEDLEDPRTCRPPGHRDAGGVDKRCRFNVLLFRCPSHRRFHMWLIERRSCTQVFEQSLKVEAQVR